MTEAESNIIQQIIAPATMIPACGLLLLSSTARLNTVLARIRAFHHERLDVWAADVAQNSRRAAVRELRLEGLEHQTDRLLRRAGLLRTTMLQLFLAIVCNLVAVLALASGFIVEGAGSLIQTGATGVFVLGILLMLTSMGTSFVEVFRVTETVHYEHARVASICTADAVGDVSPMSPASGEGTGL